MSRIFDVVKALSGQKNFIVIPSPYLDFFKGDPQAHLLGAILNQLVHWSGVESSLDNGWFYKKHEQLAEEIRGVTDDQVRKAVKKLVSSYLPDAIETATRKVNGTPTMHYRLNGDVLIAKLFPSELDSAISPNGNGSIAELKRQRSQMDSAEKPQGNGNIAESYLYTDHYTDHNLQINKPSSLQNSGESRNQEKSDFLLTHPEAVIYTPSGTSWGTAKDLDAAKWIFTKIRVVNATAKEPNWVEWSNDIRLMHEQDGRSHREICELFKWANTDSFWAANILSPRKLRVKWDELVMRSQAKVAVAPVIDNSERDSAYKRFISGTGQDVKRSELEIKVGLEASKVGVRSMGASFAVVRWNALWKECSQRVSGEAAA
ncbi:replication protein 15 [Yersinia enterocolitica]|uniref:replication protein 15 n=1 Tax=Yersinia enterocolitica TaxID=630 RepID=UPI003D007C53|nr:replication protein 15 [Yersinia enterocolitica]